MSKNLSELAGRKGITDDLFSRIGEAAADGTPSPEDMERLADEFLIGPANIHGTVSFYDLLRPENREKKAYLCNGSACLCAGTQEGVRAGLEKHIKPDEIGHMTCLGRCHENGAFHFEGRNYSAMSRSAIASLFEGKGPDRDDAYEVRSLGVDVLTRPFEGMEAMAEVLKVELSRDAREVLDVIKEAGVRGRGGAGFPMGVKWGFARNEKSDTKFIICNADEGDPGAYSDRYLLEQRPHSVLFGMVIAGYCMGAEWGVLYIRAEYPESFPVIEAAIQDFRDHGLIGRDINAHGFSFDFKIVRGQGAYICGEETALISSIEGQRPEVRTRPPFPAQRGLFNKPTIVNNVETLATVPYVMRHGASAYASLGTLKSNGTKLISLDGYFKRPGICEVEMGTTLSEVVNDLGGGFREPVKALHIGGPLGGIVPVSMIDDLTIDFESFADAGFMLGHASIVSIPTSFPMMEYLEKLMEFAAVESCGKCFPCRLGTKRAHEMFQSANRGELRIDRSLLDDLLHTLEEGSLCMHGGGIPLPVRNALQYFEGELSACMEKEAANV
ncbi:MAG: formate dehydrogenase [Verrucomicrobia bacterium]|nr:MAG: formate dehydrogenase [Verrucomicrobiota bacterium]